MFRSAQHDREGKRFNALTLQRFNESLRFQHQREIDAFAFRDIETTDCKESPAFRRVREKFARDGRRQNDKTWIRCVHELSSAMPVQRREKTFDAGAKIPNQTWFLELDRSKLHPRLQRRARYLKELIRGEKSRHHWRDREGKCDPRTRSYDRDGSEHGAAAFNCRSLIPMPCQQKREQRKCRQRIVR